MTDDAARSDKGKAWFQYVMTFPDPGLDSPLFEGVRDYAMAEVWSRPGLDMRSRRWITLTTVAAVGNDATMRAHFHAALKSGDVTFAEMREFALHFAVYAGWPKAILLEQMATEAWKRVQAEGGPLQGREAPK